MSSPRHRFGNGSWTHDFVENTCKCPPHFPAFPQFFNHQSARINTNKMPIKAEWEGSGAPECQRREIKIACKRACRGFYFSRPIRKANTCLSAIRAIWEIRG